MRTLIAVALLAATTTNPVLAETELDWIRAQIEDDLGVDGADREKRAPATATTREDLVNFSLTAIVKDIDDSDTIDLVGKGGSEICHPVFGYGYTGGIPRALHRQKL